jgi:S-methylmethionine-dependent homocysteine/selenocysteine methylase
MDLTNWSIEISETAPDAPKAPVPDQLVRRKDLVSIPELYYEKVLEWKNAGASILGGCCGIGPEHIQLIVQNLKQN